MAMGRQRDRQSDLMVGWSEMPRSPGHAFYDRLQQLLIEGGFDAFALIAVDDGTNCVKTFAVRGNMID